METPADIVGHKTFDTGELGEHGLPVMRHEPLSRAEADALLAAVDEATADRVHRMPDEQAALQAMHDAWVRLKELGWRDGCHSPRDGSFFKACLSGFHP